MKRTAQRFRPWDVDQAWLLPPNVTSCGTDSQQLVLLVKGIKENVGRQAREISADSGYCSEENLKELNRRGISGYLATGRQKHGEKTAASSGLAMEMRSNLRPIVGP